MNSSLTLASISQGRTGEGMKIKKKKCECGCGKTIENPRPLQRYYSASCSVRMMVRRKKEKDRKLKELGLPTYKLPNRKPNTKCPDCKKMHYVKNAGKGGVFCRACRMKHEKLDNFYEPATHSVRI